MPKKSVLKFAHFLPTENVKTWYKNRLGCKIYDKQYYKLIRKRELSQTTKAISFICVHS